MEEIPEAIRNTSGWIVLLLIGATIWLVIRGLRSGKFKIPTNWRKPAKAASADHHGSGDSHGHGDHGKKEPFRDKVLGWALTIGVVAAVAAFIVLLGIAMGFGQVPGASRAQRLEYSLTHGAQTASISSSCPAEWRTVTAPSVNGRRSELLDPTSGCQIHFCDKARDPNCSATSFEGARFVAWCVTDERRTELPLDLARDRYIDACRVQSKTETPIELEYRFVGPGE